MLVEYLWPATSQHKYTKETDGISLHTEYSFTPQPVYDLHPVGSALFRAMLMEPPRFPRPPPASGRTQPYLLNEDLLGAF